MKTLSGQENLRHFASLQLVGLLARAEEEVRNCSKRISAKGIHDLRVSLRRFDETLRAFRALFLKERYQAVHRELRTILKAAGRVRDIDIAVAAFRKARSAPTPDVTVQLKNLRLTAKHELLAILEEAHLSNFAARWQTQLSLQNSSDSPGGSQ